MAAGPQIERHGAEHRLGRGTRRSDRRDRTFPGALQAGDGRIGLLGGVLPRTGLRPCGQREPAVRGPYARRRVTARLHSPEGRPHGRRSAAASASTATRPCWATPRDAIRPTRRANTSLSESSQAPSPGAPSVRKRSISSSKTTPRRAPTCGCGSPRNAISKTGPMSSSRPATSAS